MVDLYRALPQSRLAICRIKLALDAASGCPGSAGRLFYKSNVLAGQVWDHVGDLLNFDRQLLHARTHAHTHMYTAEPVCDHHLEMVDTRTLCV